MAAGDIKWFAQALHDLGEKLHDLSSDTIKLALVTGDTVTPALSTAVPTYGAAGTTNMSTDAVATATAWTGPVTLAGVTWSLVSNVPTFRANNPATIAQDAGGFTDARWGIIYNDSDANKRCLAFVDLGSDRSIVAGSLAIDWNGANNDILTITQS